MDILKYARIGLIIVLSYVFARDFTEHFQNKNHPYYYRKPILKFLIVGLDLIILALVAYPLSNK